MEAIVTALRDSIRTVQIARRDACAAGFFVRAGRGGTTRGVERAGFTPRS